MAVRNNGKPDHYNKHWERNTRSIKNDYKNSSPTGITPSESDKLNADKGRSKAIKKKPDKEKPRRRKNRPIL